MSSSASDRMIRHLRRVATAGEEGPTDAALLESFTRYRDEAAFASIVRRHGPMVLAVCRRIIGRLPEAEDAFQAVFLVLARRASELSAPNLLAGWLHGVATRSALEVRTRMRRRSAGQQPLPDLPGRLDEPDADRREVLTLLDHELNKLSDKYRLPVVMCELEGRSRREVAELLGIPEGTLSSRLAAARRTLAERLNRRGVAVTGTVLAAILTQPAEAAVPVSLLNTTVTGAIAGSSSAAVTVLTERILKTMFLKKLQLSVMLLATLGVGVGLMTLGVVGGPRARVTADDKPKQTEQKPTAAAPASLLGGWKITSFIANGREAPEDGRPAGFYFAKEQGYMMVRDAAQPFKYQVDAKASPAQIDLKISRGAGADRDLTLKGIMELHGDSLKLAFDDAKDARRPMSFDKDAGERLVLITLVRDPNMKEPDAKDMQNLVKGAAARANSANNMKQIGLAMHIYADRNGSLPMPAIVNKEGKPLLSWRVAILPYIDQEELYKQFKLDQPWDSDHNKKLLSKMPGVYGREGTKTHYRALTGGGAAFEPGKRIGFADITDGTSNTIMVVEGPESVEWTKPEDYSYDPSKPLPKLGGTPFEKGFHALFGDGSVRFLTTNIKEDLLRKHITRAGGEVIENRE